MKRLFSILFMAFIVTLFTVSCSKKKDETAQKTYSELIVGKWKTNAEQPWYEVYTSDGNGKQWDEGDDVHEDEADTFTWTIEGNNLNKIVHYQETGNIVPRLYDITELNENKLVYNNDNYKESVSLIRVY